MKVKDKKIVLTDLVRFLKKEGDFIFWKNIIFMAVISGIANAGLLAIINKASEYSDNETLNYEYFGMYIIIFLIFFIAKKFSMIGSSNEVERIIKNTRTRISNKIKNSSLTTMESLDKAIVFTRLTRDTNLMSQSATELISATQSVIMVFFALIYIFILSKTMFVLVSCALLIGGGLYYFFASETQADLHKANKIEDDFFNSMQSVINGFKELKINRDKSDGVSKKHNFILEDLSTVKVSLSSKFITGMMFTETFLYILLGTIVFVIPHLVSDESTLIIQVTAAMLFIIGPLDNIIYVLPMASKTTLAINNLDNLEEHLDKNANEVYKASEKTIDNFNKFDTINLENISFNYKKSQYNKEFKLSPINFEINRSEILFVVGSNGSGKSTFIKLLLGLYYPNKGNIRIKSTRVDEFNYEAYRNLFTIILPDFYIFEELHGLKDIDEDLINELLIEMKLIDKTRYINGKFTNLDLSTGQKKRLALVVSMLDNKPIFVFDEWASDQDPEFRKYFYKVILPRLKEQGKTIIAVTHDDAYFDYCDRLIKMDKGEIKVIKDA
ncbi:MAG: cyclic peptide export ABC transporter [Campylobacterota bacterium]|nr:cyclic peptide export ABC transporter [Campylobacterota bacterium]